MAFANWARCSCLNRDLHKRQWERETDRERGEGNEKDRTHRVTQIVFLF